MENLHLSSAEVRNYLQEVELADRRHQAMGGIAEEVLRYGSFVASSLECHTSLERAMNYGRLHIDATEKDGRSVASGRTLIAESLTGSKGRFSRSWHAPVGGLWGCLIHADALLPQSSLLLSLAVGIAACEAVRQVGASTASLRWVNDVLIDDAKVAGFLIESHNGPVSGEQFHLVGFGINVNNRCFPAELAGTATSLHDAIGRPVDLKNFSLTFLAKLAWNIGLLYYIEARQPDWLDAPDTVSHPIITQWNQLSDTLGRRVVYGYDVMENPQYRAVVTGMSFDGGLQMVLEDGSAITEYSGEIRYL